MRSFKFAWFHRHRECMAATLWEHWQLLLSSHIIRVTHRWRKDEAMLIYWQWWRAHHFCMTKVTQQWSFQWQQNHWSQWIGALWATCTVAEVWVQQVDPWADGVFFGWPLVKFQWSSPKSHFCRHGCSLHQLTPTALQTAEECVVVVATVGEVDSEETDAELFWGVRTWTPGVGEWFFESKENLFFEEECTILKIRVRGEKSCMLAIYTHTPCLEGAKYLFDTCNQRKQQT